MPWRKEYVSRRYHKVPARRLKRVMGVGEGVQVGACVVWNVIGGCRNQGLILRHGTTRRQPAP